MRKERNDNEYYFFLTFNVNVNTIFTLKYLFIRAFIKVKVCIPFSNYLPPFKLYLISRFEKLSLRS